MKSKFAFSHVAGALFAQTGLDPRRVDRAITRSLRLGGDARLRPGAYHPRQIRHATGFGVVEIRRQQLHLLVTIENREPFWSYKEHGRTACEFRCSKVLPETISDSVIGRPFSELIGAHALFGDYPIIEIAKETSSIMDSTAIRLAVPWHNGGQPVHPSIDRIER